MVTITCEKTGIQFEAATRRTKNHPQIMAWLSDAYKNNWLSEAEGTIREGKIQGWTTIEQFIEALRHTEQRAKESQHDTTVRENQQKRDAQEAKRQRTITNNLLRGRGYTWRKFENDEEDQDFFNVPAYEWDLHSPDGRIVSVKEAMLELAYQNVKFAKEWLVDHKIEETTPAIEQQRQAEAAQVEAKEEFTTTQIAYQQEAIPALMEAGLSQEQAEHEAIRFSLPHSPLEDQVIIGSTIRLQDGREVTPVINSDFRYGLMENITWWGIDEILLQYPDISNREMLLIYSDRNKR